MPTPQDPTPNALIEALKAIVAETMDYPAVRPLSSQSYLPEPLVARAVAALAMYGVVVPSDMPAWVAE